MCNSLRFRTLILVFSIASINFRLKPVDLAYCLHISGNDKYALFLGPYLSMNYFLQLYPELQSGYSLWFTLYDIGPRLILETGLWDQDLKLNVSNFLAGIPTDEWADKVLFSKIELRNYNWVRYRDGLTLGGFGIETTPREMAKFALCIADEGRYKEEKVIEAAWLKEMTSEQVVVDDDYSLDIIGG